jgi:hypothetical protein
MSIRIPWPDGHLDAWKPTDESFIAAREAEWPHVEYVLRSSRKVKKKYIKKHKEFFMTGNVEKTLTKEDEFMIHLADNAGYIYFMLWYYPQNDPDAFRRIFDYSVENSNADVVARDFLDEFFRSVEHFEPEYGLMGERQENIFRAIYPSYDFFDIRTFKHSKKQVNNGPYIGRVLRDIADAYAGIFFKEQFNRYHHGLHIWDYLENYLIDKKITECKQTASNVFFYNILMIIKTNGEQCNVCWDYYDPIRLHDDYVQGVLSSIHARFENREFNDGLMWVWDNLETLCEDC